MLCSVALVGFAFLVTIWRGLKLFSESWPPGCQSIVKICRGGPATEVMTFVGLLKGRGRSQKICPEWPTPPMQANCKHTAPTPRFCTLVMNSYECVYL